jgi:hypothetical protein
MGRDLPEIPANKEGACCNQRETFSNHLDTDFAGIFRYSEPNAGTIRLGKAKRILVGCFNLAMTDNLISCSHRRFEAGRERREGWIL